MLGTCVLLGVLGVVAYASGIDHLINGANLAISVLTLLMLPVLQASQNRDGAALQAKLDELIKTNVGARDALIGLEKRSESEIEQLRCEEEQAGEAIAPAQVP